MTVVADRQQDAPPQVRRRRSPRQWAAAGALGALSAASVGYLLTHDPHVPGRYPTCILLELTGLACPACGGTRAAYDLAHGDVAQAFTHNALVPLAVLATVLVVAYRVISRRRGRTLAPMPMWVPMVIGLVVVAFGVLRNLPGLEFLGPA